MAEDGELNERTNVGADSVDTFVWLRFSMADEEEEEEEDRTVSIGVKEGIFHRTPCISWNLGGALWFLGVASIGGEKTGRLVLGGRDDALEATKATFSSFSMVNSPSVQLGSLKQSPALRSSLGFHSDFFLMEALASAASSGGGGP